MERPRSGKTSFINALSDVDNSFYGTMIYKSKNLLDVSVFYITNSKTLVIDNIENGSVCSIDFYNSIIYTLKKYKKIKNLIMSGTLTEEEWKILIKRFSVDFENIVFSVSSVNFERLR